MERLWARICVDVDDRQNVHGWSVEVHVGDELEAIHVFPCGPFDSPGDEFLKALVWLFERYGTQLELIPR
jgi:hypothetical protein